IVGAVFQQGFFDVIEQMRHGAHGLGTIWELLTSREVVMVAAAAVSRAVTGRGAYEANEFSFGPIREVAILFVGIFATLVPAGTVRQTLEAVARYHPDDVAAGKVSDQELEVGFLIGVPLWNWFVVAISAGSVFWGACTYIGNGPNFMVKSIADAAGVKTPG